MGDRVGENTDWVNIVQGCKVDSREKERKRGERGKEGERSKEREREREREREK